LRIWGAETPEPIAAKFCMPGAVQDVITHASFGEDQLQLGVLAWRGLLQYIDLRRRHYNTVESTVRVCDLNIYCAVILTLYRPVTTGGGSVSSYEPPPLSLAITLVRLVRFSYMYSAS